MYPKSIQKLIDLFAKFPGIGPRQATRFVFYLIKDQSGVSSELQGLLEEIKKKIVFCNRCFRTLEKSDATIDSTLCTLCKDPKRDHKTIAVVEKESDMQNFEHTGEFNGHYHVLGGVIAPLDHNSPASLHLRELHTKIKEILDREKKAEVILATSTTTEGDITALYIERILAPLKEPYPDFKISRLGRGLSLGAELEYADPVTLKNALNNRK